MKEIANVQNNKKDKHHIAAVTANKQFLDSGYFYVTSDYIMDETYTLLRYDIGHERTVEFGRKIKSLEKSEKIIIIHIDQDMKEKAWNVFEKYKVFYCLCLLAPHIINAPNSNQ